MGVEIIKNTKEARDIYGRWWGSGDVILSKQHIQALLDGECIAFNDGEYAHFISIEGPKE